MQLSRSGSTAMLDPKSQRVMANQEGQYERQCDNTRWPSTMQGTYMRYTQ